MTNDRTCHECGTPVIDPPDRCPSCGSTKIDQTVRVSPLEITVSIGTPTIIIEPLWQSLLRFAEHLHRDGSFGPDIVLAHTACELVAERATTTAFANADITAVGDAVDAFVSSYNLATKRNRRVYTAITGDDGITQQPWWQSFAASADRRHAMVHRGVRPRPDDARASLDACFEFIRHIASVNGLDFDDSRCDRPAAS